MIELSYTVGYKTDIRLIRKTLELSKTSLGDTILLGLYFKGWSWIWAHRPEPQGEYDLPNLVGVHGFKDGTCLGLLNNLHWLPARS